MRSLRLGFLCLFLTACAGRPASIAEPPASPRPADPDLVRYELTWNPAETLDATPTADVTFEVDVDFVTPAPSSVTLFFVPLELEQGSPSGVRFFDADARAVVDEEAGTFTWPVVDGVATGHYRARLDHARFGAVRGVDNVPHPTAGGWTVPGRALFPALARIDDGRSIDGPTRLTYGGPLPHHDSAGLSAEDSDLVPEMRMMSDAVHTFGDYRAVRLEQDASAVRLLTSDYDEAELAPLADLIRRTLALGSALLGPAPPGAITVVVDRVGDRHEGGLVGPRGIVLSGPSLGELPAFAMPGRIVVHELMHLWARADTPWLNEGLARLLEFTGGVLLAELDADQASALLQERVNAYLSMTDGHRPLVDPTGAWPYEGGFALLVCAESALRPGGSSILEVHRAVREAHGAPLPTEAFLEALVAEEPSLETQLPVWLAGAIPLGACLRQLGVAAEEAVVTVPSMRTLVVELLGATGIDTDTMTVERVRDGSSLHVGDRLERIADARVRSLTQLAWVVGHAAGETITLEVLRDGQTHSIPLAVPTTLEEERPTLTVGPGTAAARLISSPTDTPSSTEPDT
ncbi:MAG: hypothetical protein AB8I08_10975 [Sandaracinaceae bacterium]